MNTSNYLHLIPQIEAELERLKLDSLVIGMGPTAWLLRYVDRRLTENLRLWGCHDGCRILPMDDLVIMDAPHTALHPDTSRHKHIVDARPKRLWVYERNYPSWKPFLHEAVSRITQTVPMGVWVPERTHPKSPFKLEVDPIHTIAISPTGMTTLAWREGCRRIGVIGVDMMKNHHHTYRWHQQVDGFFRRCAEQAHEKGGLIANLSPITSLKDFVAWTQSASSSAPTATSKEAEPNSCSSTPSASTQAAPSSSCGCGVETLDGKSASGVILAPGESAKPSMPAG